MSARKIAAVRALGRWRAFQEALAERRNLQAAAAVCDARSTLAEAQACAVAIVRRRMDMLVSSQLDPGQLQFVAGMEEGAWHAVAHRQSQLACAEDAAATAQEAHLHARAQTRVVDSRRERLTAAEEDFLEKQRFDRMAALRAPPNIGGQDD